MKRIFSVIVLAVILVGETFAQIKTVNAAESTIEWTGAKVTGKHTGTINITEGTLSLIDGTLTGGALTIDMTSIAVTDLQGKMAGKLTGHLQSDDFFGVATFPTAHLVITNVVNDGDKYAITGDLTIKGKTAPVTFDAMLADGKATATIVVDRTIYDVKYGSGKFFDNLGDKMISDNFDLAVSLVF